MDTEITLLGAHGYCTQVLQIYYACVEIVSLLIMHNVCIVKQLLSAQLISKIGIMS